MTRTVTITKLTRRLTPTGRTAANLANPLLIPEEVYFYQLNQSNNQPWHSVQLRGLLQKSIAPLSDEDPGQLAFIHSQYPSCLPVCLQHLPQLTRG